MRYQKVDAKANFPQLEEKILAFWKKNDIFQRSIDQRAGKESYIFYDGPPFATGLPHFGHFVPGTLKDIFPRYHAMKGKRVPRRFGWDCHGLPVENEVQKSLGLQGNKSILAYGIDKFNEACRGIVLRYTTEWQTIIERMGRWVDFENDYKTMDKDYMESTWWVFKTLYEKGLIYEGHRILPYSPKLASPLSNFEVNLGGYRDVHDPAITVRFQSKEHENRYFLAWTTTPWTLPSNLALAVGPDISYVVIAVDENEYVLSEDVLAKYFPDASAYKVVHTMTGKDLVGSTYVPLFPYFQDIKEQGAFAIYAGSYVTTGDGTGIVHTAPGFGEDDFDLLKDTQVPVVCPIDVDCCFTTEVSDFAGLFVKDADKPIIAYLEKKGVVLKKESYLHSYPFCYRSDTPLIFRAVSSYFVHVEEIKELLLATNSTVQWVPEHIRDGRFGKWLEGARDWSISRNRFWGNPIPVWKADDGSHIEVIGSAAELEERSGKPIADLHKHITDEHTWLAPNGKATMRRVPDVLDCWFESGSMPYAQVHYPFEQEQDFTDRFPADFICEGLDQTRGWFYTLMVLAGALYEKPAFKNVIVNGLILNKDSKKMSKSLRNYTDPVNIINTYGADALRFYLMHSPVVQGEDLKYTDDGVVQVLKTVIIPLWNTYSFFVTYANLDKVNPTGNVSNIENPLDVWILSETEKLVQVMTNALDAYSVREALDPVTEYIDMLSNWYVRRSRRRFWRSENDHDKLLAYETLYACLKTLCTLLAPVIPFITEAIYQNLRQESDPVSLHLCDYPQFKTTLRDTQIEYCMQLVRKCVRLGHALRKSQTINTRQVLSTMYIVTPNDAEKNILHEFADVIRDELNVKTVQFRDNEEDLVVYSAHPNYRKIGKKLGKRMKDAALMIAQLTSNEVRTLMDGEKLYLSKGQFHIELVSDDIEIRRHEKEGLSVINEGAMTVGLDTTITEELRMEGQVRDVIRQVQLARKDAELAVSDRMVVSIQLPEEQKQALQRFSELFKQETLCKEIIHSTQQEMYRFTIKGLSGSCTVKKHT